MAIDPGRLQQILLNTGLQTKDAPLFQLLKLLIDNVSQINNSVSSSGGSSSSSGTTVIQQISNYILAESGNDGEDGFPVPLSGPAGSNGSPGPTGPIGTNPFLLGEDGLDGDLFMIPGPIGPAGSAGSGGLVLLEQHIASASTDIQLKSWYSSTYDEYIIELINIIPATNNVDLMVRCSTDGGATYDSGTNYARALRFDNQVFNTVLGANSGLTSIILSANVATTANFSLNGSLKMFNPASAIYKPFTYQGLVKNNDGNIYSVVGHGMYLVTTAVNALQFIFSAGNIASGTIRIYGVSK